MSELNKISNLKFWCQKVLPLVYDDSLSYYEVLAKIGSKLNEVINNTNEQNEKLIEMSTAIDEFMTETNQRYTEFTEQINTMFTEKSTELETTVTNAINNLTNVINNNIAEFDNAWQEFLREYQVSFGIESGFGDSETNAISQKTLTDAFYNNIGENKTILNVDITNPSKWVYAGITSNPSSTAYRQLENSIYYAYNPGTSKRISYLNLISPNYYPIDINENEYAIQITPKTPTTLSGIVNYAFYGFYYDGDNIVAERITDSGTAWSTTPLYISLSKYIKIAIALRIVDGTQDAVLNINNLNDYIDIKLLTSKNQLFNKEYIYNDESAIMQKTQNKYTLLNENVVFSRLEKYPGVWANYNISSTASGIQIGTTGKYLNSSTKRLCTTYQVRNDSSKVFQTNDVYNLGNIKFINIIPKTTEIEYGVRVYDKDKTTETILTGDETTTYIDTNNFYDVSSYTYIGIVIKYKSGADISIDTVSDLIDVIAISIDENEKNYY